MQTEQLNFFDSLFMENVESNTTSTLLEKQSNSLVLKDTSAETSEDIRHKAQANRKVAYDVGQKIGGAIKDLAALRKMFEDKPSIETLSAVEEEDSVAAAEILTRDVFFNWFSMEVCHKNDVNIRAAYGMHLMIRRIPKNAKGLDRNAYINALTLISDEMQRVQTFKQFNDFYHRLSTMEMCRPSIVDRFIRRINNTEESIGFEDNPQILKGLHEQLEKNKGFLNLTDYYDSYKWDQLGKFSELIGSNKKLRTFNSSINKYPTWVKYFEVNPPKVNTVDDDTDQKEKPKRSNKPVWERVLPQQPTHNSPHKVQAFKTPEEFRHYFGFRSVEFGNYLNDEIGFKHMNNCAQAYVDLAHILEVSKERMSLDYELAMAFGARGKGRALGHFERSYNVINLTRDKGSLGILAHEWFHGVTRFAISK